MVHVNSVVSSCTEALLAELLGLELRAALLVSGFPSYPDPLKDPKNGNPPI